MQAQIGYELNRFTKDQRKIIYENLFAIELTEGCSIGCDFCGLESIRGIGNAIPFSVLEQIAQEIPDLTNRITHWRNNSVSSFPPNCLYLYDATDPLDYQQDGKNYFDVSALFSSRGFKIGTSTAIPAGKEELAIANLDNLHQISLSHMNRERLQPYFKKLKVAIFVDLFNFYNAKFGNYGYNKAPMKDMVPKVEGTIQETVKQLRKQDSSIPKKSRFYDLRIDGNRLRKHVQDLKTLFLFCGNQGPYALKGKVVDRDHGQVRNNGRAFNLGYYEREYPDDPLKPFGNTQGVKITPLGVFNVFCVNPTAKNTAGRIIEKISPNYFHIVKLDHPPHLTNFTTISPFEYVSP